MEFYFLATAAIAELVIILYLIFAKKKKVVKEISSDFNNQIRLLRQRISALKIQAEKSNERNKALESKAVKLEEKIAVITTSQKRKKNSPRKNINLRFCRKERTNFSPSRFTILKIRSLQLKVISNCLSRTIFLLIFRMKLYKA